MTPDVTSTPALRTSPRYCRTFSIIDLSTMFHQRTPHVPVFLSAYAPIGDLFFDVYPHLSALKIHTQTYSVFVSHTQWRHKPHFGQPHFGQLRDRCLDHKHASLLHQKRTEVLARLGKRLSDDGGTRIETGPSYEEHPPGGIAEVGLDEVACFVSTVRDAGIPTE